MVSKMKNNIEFNDNLLRLCLDYDIIFNNDIMSLLKEDIIMNTIERIHKYKITKTSDGRYTTYVPDKTKPNGLKQVRRYSQAKLYKFLLEFYGIKEEKKILYSDLFMEWIDYKRNFVGANNKGLSQSTIRRYERDYDNYLASTEIVMKNIADITSIDLETALKSIIENNKMHAACFKNLFGYVKNSFEYAWRKQYIQNNPICYVDKDFLLTFCIPDEPKIDEDRVLTIQEFSSLKKAVLNHESKHPLYMPDYAIELAMLSGMRVGEISVLMWTDIRDGYIYIDRAEQRLDYSDRVCEIVIGEPKNRKHRKFPITPEISELFERISKLDIKGEFIFSRENGERYKAHDISCAVDRRAKEADIPKTSIHGIRRTVSSFLNGETNLSRETIANMLGHLPATNERFYDYDITDKNTKIKALSELSYKVINFSNSRANEKELETAN